MNTKRAIAVQHHDGIIEYECPGCGNYMVGCDTSYPAFSRGEVSDDGREYLYCQKCGREAEYPTSRETRLPEVGF